MLWCNNLLKILLDRNIGHFFVFIGFHYKCFVGFNTFQKLYCSNFNIHCLDRLSIQNHSFELAFNIIYFGFDTFIVGGSIDSTWNICSNYFRLSPFGNEVVIFQTQRKRSFGFRRCNPFSNFNFNDPNDFSPYSIAYCITSWNIRVFSKLQTEKRFRDCFWLSLSNCKLLRIGKFLSYPTFDIVLSKFVIWIAKNFFGCISLNQVA